MAASTEESEFANAIAHYIGYDPRVVYSWAQLESGGHAIGHNWMNIRPAGNEVGVVGTSPGGFAEFDSVQNAAISTEHVLHQSNMAGIGAAGGPGHTPAEQIAALAASPWDAGPTYADGKHYGYGGPGGPNLVNVFNSLYPDGKITAPGSSHVVASGGAQTQSSLTDKLTGTTGSGGVGGIFDGLVTFLKEWVLRGSLILFGSGIILLGLYMIVRSLGGPGAAVLDTATTVATRGLVKPKAPAASPSRRKGDAAASRGEEVTRTGPPEPVTRADRRQSAKNERARQREAAGASAGNDEIPF